MENGVVTNAVNAEALGSRCIEFWFDFASGYAYFAALEIEALSERHGRVVIWRPFSLASAFKVTGAAGLSSTPLKREYARRDWSRLARRKAVEFNPPPRHPLTGLSALRAFYYFEQLDRRAATSLAKTLLFGYFEEGLNIDDPQVVAMAAFQIGLNPDLILEHLDDPDIKERAKSWGDEAVARGVFGSPWFFVDGEPFWGHDRLPMIEEWLEHGPW